MTTLGDQNNGKTATSTTDEKAVDEIEIEKILHMEVDTRIYQWCRNNVTLTEVIDAVEIEHDDDWSKSIKPVRGVFGIFKIDADD